MAAAPAIAPSVEAGTVASVCVDRAPGEGAGRWTHHLRIGLGVDRFLSLRRALSPPARVPGIGVIPWGSQPRRSRG